MKTTDKDIKTLTDFVCNYEYNRSTDCPNSFIINYEDILLIENLLIDFEELKKKEGLKMKKQKKMVFVLGKIKNAILIASVLFSILFLFSESFIYNSYIYTFILKLACLFNIYCFVRVNSDYIINN